MSLLDMDGFDFYATADVAEVHTAVNGTVSIGAFGRNGTNGLRCTANGSNARNMAQTLAPSGAGFVMGFGMVTSVALTSAGFFATITDAGSIQLILRLNVDMTISVLRGASTVLGTTSASLQTGVYAHIEFKGTINNTTGTVVLRINETEVLNLSAQDTQATANASWNGYILGLSNNGVPGTASFDYDDLYVLDQAGSAPWNDFLGDCRVAALFPTAEGNSSQWTPSTGTDNAALVDESTPNDDTDYVTTATTGNKDTHVMANLPVSGVIVFGVQGCIAARKETAGSSEIALVTRHSGTDYDATGQGLGTAYAYLRFIQEVNPGTAAQWTETDINAAEFGYKKTV